MGYINNQAKGLLPYAVSTPACGVSTATDGLTALNLDLPSGTYQLVGKDEAGREVSRGLMKICRDKVSISGNLGGQSVDNREECLAVGVFE